MTAIASPPRPQAPPPQAGRFRVLEADPDLLRGFDGNPEAAAEATRCALARVGAVPAGPWAPRMSRETAGAIGLLVLEGLLQRTVSVGSETASELVGPGDLLRPWQDDGGSGLLASRSAWRVLEPVQVAVLDRSFALAIAPWPELSAELHGRALRRSRWLGVATAISHMRRVDDRLLAFLWHLADRWGRVTPEGVTIPVSLTHAQLADLVGAQRPSVTTGLVRLREGGLLLRRDDRTWTVTHHGRAALAEGRT